MTEHDDLSVAHDALAEIVRLRILTVEQHDEIERLTAENEKLSLALEVQPGPVNMDDVEWAGKVHLAEAIRERDELRRQLDPMGEFASADELIAALRAEKAEDEAMKRDAECWRELDRMMSDPDARLNVNAGGWAVLKCGLLGKLGGGDV